MENKEENLNTEPNDIAGNRIDGPVGNTAAQHSSGPGIGQPQGSAPAGRATETAAAPASSESLAASETSVAQGAVDDDAPAQENKEADPAALVPQGSYGGNFSNSTQNSYQDEDRRENQDSDPNRGEFGVQSQSGTTHGGFGNQNRQADYEPNNTSEDKYYGGPGAPGSQDNAYRAYDGRDERPDSRTEYGFAPGTTVTLNPTTKSTHPNDNGSPKGKDSGFANSYGTTSLRAMQAPDAAPKTNSATGLDPRNQTEDYMPAPGDINKPSTSEAPINPEASGPRPAGSQGRNQPNEAPDFQTGGERNGYAQPQANNGDSGQGVGSRGGSYNDAYDDSKPNSQAGSPAKGEERSEDRSQNYGPAARQENRTDNENAADHGAPQRNAGRDGEADE
jgi:hypothetical protein